MFAGYYWLLSVTSLLLQSSSHAQLIGSITSPGNPFIITVTINNPSTNNISVLKWNNIFDYQLLIPPSFTVKDAQGDDVQFATTYAFRSGITNDDFQTLSPDENFTRTYDLRQFLEDVPGDQSAPGPENIQIILPASFQGLVSNEPLNIPVQAAANLAQGVLGDYSAAGLTPITLNAAPYTVQLNFPIFQGAQSLVTNPFNGVQLHNATCTGTNATMMSNAIFDAGVYAHSAQLAASDTSSVLFPQFFQDSQRLAVTKASLTATLTLQGDGPHTDAYCSDPNSLCDSKGSILGYSFTPSFLASSYVVLCPAALSLGRAPAPCSTPPGKQVSASASHVLFHLVLTLNNAIGSMIGNNYYGAQEAMQLANSTTVDATGNADSYAQLGIAQWAYGEGGAPYSGPACLPANDVIPGNQKRTQREKDLDSHSPDSVGSRAVLSRRQGPNPTIAEALAGIQPCTGNQLTLLQNTAANVRALAAAARDNPNYDLWTQVFNGDATLKRQVYQIFDIIAKWSIQGNNAGITFFCDPPRQSLACTHGTIAVIAGSPSTQTANIVLCPPFFYQPQALECEAPSFYNPRIDEMAGSLLHELTHVPWLVGRDVQDGYISGSAETGYCYDWNCVTQYAQERNLPTFDTRNNPENVATAYQYYALAARAAATDCSWKSYVGSMFGLGG